MTLLNLKTNDTRFNELIFISKTFHSGVESYFKFHNIQIKLICNYDTNQLHSFLHKFLNARIIR